MKTFNFYQDIKCSIWRRQHFSIEAENETEAKRIAMKFQNEDVSNYDEYLSSELNYETEELIPVDENNGADTIQLYLKGENQPFATNGEIFLNNFNQFKNAHEMAAQDIENNTIEATDCWGGGEYYAFHEDNKLNIIVTYFNQTAVRFTFDESWQSLVEKNKKFRKVMSDYLIKKDEENTPLVHDWLNGHLTAIANTSMCVENKTPFDLYDVVNLWGKYATKKIYTAGELIGYQVVGDDGELPDGYFSFQVFKDKHEATRILRKTEVEEPHKTGMTIYPIYEGDVEEPTFI